jgi:hypothetical protein
MSRLSARAQTCLAGAEGKAAAIDSAAGDAAVAAAVRDAAAALVPLAELSRALAPVLPGIAAALRAAPEPEPKTPDKASAKAVTCTPERSGKAKAAPSPAKSKAASKAKAEGSAPSKRGAAPPTPPRVPGKRATRNLNPVLDEAWGEDEPVATRGRTAASCSADRERSEAEEEEEGEESEESEDDLAVDFQSDSDMEDDETLPGQRVVLGTYVPLYLGLRFIGEGAARPELRVHDAARDGTG